VSFENKLIPPTILNNAAKPFMAKRAKGAKTFVADFLFFV